MLCFKNKYFVYFALIILLMIQACEKNPEKAGLTDIDGNVYDTVVIGTQVWMAENLRVQRAPDRRPVVSRVYADEEGRHGRYGHCGEYRLRAHPAGCS